MNNSSKVLLGVLSGAVAGAVAGLLLAPEKGKDTRKKIVEKGEDLVDGVKSKYEDVVSNISDKLNFTKNEAEEAVEEAKAEKVKKAV